MSRPTTPLPNPSTCTTNPFTSPPRSSTHPVKPRHQHIPHHPHRTHHHHRHDKSVPQSAFQPTSSNPFGDFLAKTSSKIDGFQTPPREQQQQQLRREEAEREQALREEAEKERVRVRERDTWKEVERLRGRRKAADEELRSTLSNLSTLSTSTTRRLDYTYYSLLSSLSSLTSTISDLHKLCSSTTELSTRFNDESTSMSKETELSIQYTNNNFDAQAQRIEDLEKRMQDGRTRVNNLSLRLDAVRTKVETSAKRDVEDENRLGRRLKMLWGCLGCWVIIFLVLIIARQRGIGVDIRTAGLVELGHGILDQGQGVDGVYKHESKIEEEKREVAGRRDESKTTRWEGGVNAEATLRLFDEL